MQKIGRVPHINTKGTITRSFATLNIDMNIELLSVNHKEYVTKNINILIVRNKKARGSTLWLYNY